MPMMTKAVHRSITSWLRTLGANRDSAKRAMEPIRRSRSDAAVAEPTISGAMPPPASPDRQALREESPTVCRHFDWSNNNSENDDSH